MKMHLIMTLLIGLAPAIAYCAQERPAPELGEFGKLPVEVIKEIASRASDEALSRWGQTSSLLNSITQAELWNRYKLATYWATGKIKPMVLRRGRERRASVGSVAFSPNGKLLATGSRDGYLILWDAQTGKKFKTLQDYDYRRIIYSVTFSPDGKLLASGDFDGNIVLWDVDTGEGKPLGHTGIVYSLAFSSDGGILASASADHTISLWDMGKRQLKKVLEGHTMAVKSVAFSCNGLLASGSLDATVRLWDVESGENKILGKQKSRVNSVAFSHDGKQLVAGTAYHSACLWDAVSGRLIKKVENMGWVWSVAFSPDDKIVAIAPCEYDYENGYAIKLLSKRNEITIYMSYETGPSESVAWSPDGKLLAEGTERGAIIIWKVVEGKY